MNTNFSKKDLALAKKEGGKKGQDLSGLEDMGGIHFFHVALEDCKGEWELIEEAMKGANSPVDENAEDRKGGAQNIGKAFLSASDKDLCIYVHLPSALSESSKITLTEWFNVLVKSSNANIILIDETRGYAKAQVSRTDENEVFPLKLRDHVIGEGFSFLRSKGVVPEEEDSSSMEMDDCGVEW